MEIGLECKTIHRGLFGVYATFISSIIYFTFISIWTHMVTRDIANFLSCVCECCLTQGTVTSGVMYVAYSWCLRRKGPLFVSIFSPLMLVIVAFAGSTILDEKLYLGRYTHFF